MSNLHPIFADLLAPFGQRENDQDRFEAETKRTIDPIEELLVAGYGKQARLLENAAKTLKRIVYECENGLPPRPEEIKSARSIIAAISGR